MILVSACLLGENCKYSGGNNANALLIDYLKDKEYISVCPEVMGGLPTPRACCERVKDRVINNLGEDVTEAFIEGAKQTLAVAQANKCTLCILQVRSPSCGAGRIYDGTFSGRVIEGNGITAQYLLDHGFNVISSEAFTEQLKSGKIDEERLCKTL